MDVGLAIAFYGLATVTVVSALLVVTLKNIFHAVLLLILSFAGVAGTYITLNADFLAAVQILIYAGAIAILMLFAMMLTRDPMTQGNLPSRLQGPALITALLVLVTLGFVILGTQWNLGGEAVEYSASSLADALFNKWVLPFEVASVLLLIAMIGAIVLARE